MTAANEPTGAPVSPSVESPAPPESITIQAIPPTPTSATVVQESTAPPKEPVTPERFAARLRRLDVVAVGLVLVLAFFLGSFAAHNSDFWQHLALGRLIAHGQYHFGEDPFAYSIQESGSALWTNASWLFDWALYQMSAAPDGGLPALGGAAIIILKALLVVILAGLMIRIRRAGSSAWIPLCLTTLGLVVMMPRLLLQPTIVSFLLLGLTLYLLQAPGSAASDKPGRTPRRRWFLPLVCLLWANLDNWFLLGPVTIGLYLLGEACQSLLPSGSEEEQPAERGSLPALGLIFVLSLVACLLNPTFLAHPRLDAASFVPADLLAVLTDSPVQQQAAFRGLFVDPLHPDYYQYYFGGSVLSTPVALSYFVMLGLGLLSFAVNFKDWRWWRAFVWLPFALLSLMAARAIPFFAIVGAVVAALNFQDFAVRCFGPAPQPGGRGAGWAVAGRILTVLAGVALLVAAWPGWLYPHYDDALRTRHVAWTIVPSASLQKSALRLHELYAQEVLQPDQAGQPGTRGFNTTPDIANYCAWFCPEEKCFFDFRLTLYPESVASAYAQVRQGLMPALVDSSDTGADLALREDWKEILKNAHVNHVVLHDANITALYQALQKLWVQDRQHWALLYADGQTAVLGWKEASDPAAQPFAGSYIDLDSLAFGPNALRMPQESPDPPQPPESWVEQTLAFLREYWEGPQARPAGIDQVTMYLLYFENSAYSTRPYYRATNLWAGLATPLMTLDSGAGMPLEILNYKLLAGSLAGYADSALSSRKDFGPPAAPLLAVRTARAAVAANPRSADAYLMLAQAYDALLQSEEEPWLSTTGSSTNPLIQLRRIQVISALQSAIVLNPNHFLARSELARQLYQYMHYYDLADDLLKENLDRQRDHGPRSGESEEDFDARLDRQDQQLQGLEKQWRLQKNEDLYDNQVNGQNPPPPMMKVQLALQAGLAKRALEALKDADPEQLGPKGNEVLFNLLITTGKLQEAAKPLTESLQDNDSLVALYLAAIGDYDHADERIERYLQVQSGNASQGILTVAQLYALREGLEPTNLAALRQAALMVRQQMDWRVLRGVLALEKGDTQAATLHFREVVRMTLPPMDEKTTAALLDGHIALDQVAWLAKGGLNGGWPGVDCDNRAIAYHYLPLLQQAGSSK